MGFPLDAGPAPSLQTTGSPVNVSAAAPPSGAGKVLTTTDSTHATWQAASSGFTYSVIRESANFNATNGTGSVYAVSASGGAVMGSLPVASSSSGVVLGFKKTDSSGNVVTVTPNGADTIDGVSGSVTLTVEFDYLELVSDGVSDWIVK